MISQLKNKIDIAKHTVDNAICEIEYTLSKSLEDQSTDSQLAGIILQDLLKEASAISEKIILLNTTTQQ